MSPRKRQHCSSSGTFKSMASSSLCSDFTELSSPPPPPAAPPITIEAISDKELLYIFNLLPLLDLIHVEAVNPRWRWIHSISCRMKRELSLVGDRTVRRNGAWDITRYWFFTDHRTVRNFEDISLYSATGLSKESVDWLGLRFSKITKLSLYRVTFDLFNFIQMTQQWPNLTSLTIFLSPESTLLSVQLFHSEMFWQAVNSLKQLTHLALPFEFDVHLNLFTWLTPILPRLQSLYINVHPHSQARTAQPEDQVWLGRLIFAIHYPILGEFCFYAIGNLTTRENDHTRMSFYPKRYVDPNESVLRTRSVVHQLLVHYPAITHLDLGLPPQVGFDLISPLLSEFSHLEHLRLVSNSGTELNTLANPSPFSSGIPRRDYERSLTVLKTIRSLHLVRFDLTSGLTYLFLEATFPNLEVLHLERCTMVRNSKWLLECLRSKFVKLEAVMLNYRVMFDRFGSKAQQDGGGGSKAVTSAARKVDLAIMKQICSNN